VADKVIVFSGARAAVITQMDLCEERALYLQASEANKAWEEKREWIRARLKEGWVIEPGLRSAELVHQAASSFTVQRKESFRLTVR